MTNFTNLNQLLKQSVKNPTSELVQDLVQVDQSRISTVLSTAEAEARTYVMVQELTVKSDGNVEDQTSEERKSVAINTLRGNQIKLKELKARAEALEQEINAQAPADTSVTLKFKVPRRIRKWQHEDYEFSHNTFSSGVSAAVINRGYDVAASCGMYLDATTHDSLSLEGRSGYSSLLFDIDVNATVGAQRIVYQLVGIASTLPSLSNVNGVLGRNFSISLATSSGSAEGKCAESVQIPLDAFSTDIDRLLRWQLVKKSVLNVGQSPAKVETVVGWQVTRKASVTDDDINSVPGAADFLSAHENKVFCGVVVNTYAKTHVVLGSGEFTPQLVNYVTSLTETPFEQDMTTSFQKYFDDVIAFTKSPALQQILPDYTERYSSLKDGQDRIRFTRGLCDCRAQVLMYSPETTGNTPDAQIMSYVSPWTTFVLGSAKLSLTNTYDVGSSVGRYAHELASYLAWFGFPGDININLTSDNVSSYLPAGNVEEGDAIISNVPGTPLLGSAIAHALLLSNQNDVEGELLSL